jgi:hypothetical protein
VAQVKAVRTAIAVAMLGLAATGTAAASEPLGDFNVKGLTIAANASGEALLTYRRENGKVRHVLVWGALNARAPNPTRKQVAFHYDYGGGWGKYRRVVWRSFSNLCSRYDGPPLVYVIAACRAADGSYWAVQAWQRLLPMRGFAPWRPQQAAYEFHVSHWTGQLAVLEVSPNWTYGGAWQGLFGHLTYAGYPVYGYRTPSPTQRDPYARYVYIDTYNSRYGKGWRHDAAKVLHLRNGAFCFSFVPQRPPPGYPTKRLRGPGNGERHRVTVMGPGVTPDVQWEGAGLGRYDPVADQEYNRLFDSYVGPDDKVCTKER